MRLGSLTYFLDAVAALTAKIKAMADHMRVHRKDYHSRRGLEAMLNQRKSLLQYLRRKDFDSYAIVLSRLGLRDNYMKLVRLSLDSCLYSMHTLQTSQVRSGLKECTQHNAAKRHFLSFNSCIKACEQNVQLHLEQMMERQAETILRLSPDY